MLSDIEIAQSCKLEEIKKIASKLNISEDYIEQYGKYKAKITDRYYKTVQNNPDAKLILVTAINPTPAGEGKTTTTIGLGQAMNLLGKKCTIALREPSLGPVMGVKGGAAGGGYAQVVPMEDINLHFTGDIHAITAANNLLSAVIDNHLHQGNSLNIDPCKITWIRALDMNDRALRKIVVGLGGKINGIPREDSFQITVASEIMAVLCLATNLEDLKHRLSEIIVAYSYDNEPIKVSDLNVQGALATLLKDAIKPNLVQTLENTPVFMHGGPFANIAHVCNSITATTLALKTSDYVITEAGFGADLGAEKFFNIKCRYGNLHPDATVLVATVRALKYNGGVNKNDLSIENIDALKKGILNLGKHIENIKKFNVPVVVAINSFYTDSDAELKYISDYCKEKGVKCCVSNVFADGGEGGIELANVLLEVLETEKSNFKPLYDLELSIPEKIEIICKEIYGANKVNYSSQALKAIAQIDKLGYSNLPICIAKTQYSFSDDPSLLGCPSGFDISVKEIELRTGAGFIVVKTGNIMTMPGLPPHPAAEKIDVDSSGNISGLF